MAHLLVSLKSVATIVEGFLRQPKAIDKITLIMWNLAGFRGVEPEQPWLRIVSGSTARPGKQAEPSASSQSRVRRRTVSRPYRTAASKAGRPWLVGGRSDHSSLTLAARTTLPHFSVSSAMSLPKSAGEPPSAMPPSSASLALILGSARPAAISLLSFAMMSMGVFLGTHTPFHPLAS